MDLLDTDVISAARKPAPNPKAWLSALQGTWTLVTRNVKNLARTGVRLLNPFDEPG